ncbi:MAG: hypothetical protein MJ135_04410 [Oscillospiraceae bacterium]|nr:hypothetical protein [Oscillospiraceae bacterium]
MALDPATFDSIHFDLEHRKYYNADRVNRVLEELRSEALELTERNLTLQEQNCALREQNLTLQEQNSDLQELLRAHEDRAREISTALIDARAAAGRILADAREEAANIVADAKMKAAKENARQWEDRSALEQDLRRKSGQLELLIGRVEGIYANIRQQYEDMLEAANRDWQDFLCALPDELVDTLPADVDVEEPLDAVPADLGDRIRSIADPML